MVFVGRRSAAAAKHRHSANKVSSGSGIPLDLGAMAGQGCAAALEPTEAARSLALEISAHAIVSGGVAHFRDGRRRVRRFGFGRAGVDLRSIS
jgi:hypothetical protein